MRSPLLPLLTSFSWQELRHHPWRNTAALVSVMLGVALAFSVHLINASALDEFSQAVRSVGGQPDLELRASAGQASAQGASVPEAMLSRLQGHAEIALVSPVLEFNTYALTGTAPGKRTLLRVVGVDATQVGAIAPDLLPLPSQDADRLDVFAPETVFLNATAQALLGSGPLRLQSAMQFKPVRVAGSVRAAGGPVAVMDIAAAQDFFGKPGQVSRMDIRLRSGVDHTAFARRLQAQEDWPSHLVLGEPGDPAQRIGKLSRAYRVNLTVLALVALFTGGFLVFSVLALSVTRRVQQFALLGVLGLTAGQRLRLVLWEAAALGMAGSALGIALGTGLAQLALQVLGGDLGGGFFAGSAPPLQWSAPAALGFGAMGLVAALAGAWGPARLAQRMAPAQALKGLGANGEHGVHPVWGLALLAAACLLALAPPVWDMPLAAYASVALLLMGGITALPWLVGLVLDRLAPMVQGRALPMLAIERTRRVRQSAAVAISAVVASLSLAVALTVMVASFRNSVIQWLDSVLPASLYLRAAGNSSAGDTAYLDPAFVQAAARIAGVERVTSQRTLLLQIHPALPAVTLIARPLRDGPNGAISLPLQGEPLRVPPGRIGIYVSEAMVDLYGARPGSDFARLDALFMPPARMESAQTATFFVAGVWRDYARQFGTVAMEQADFERLSGDRRVNDMAFWLAPDVETATVEQALRQIADRLAGAVPGEAGGLLEFGSAREIRATSLKIFDRSFAVTYWLQAVAIGIGLFGVAASFSAQVLARRKEFGLLVHLGLTRRQILQVVAGEGAAWTALGALAGIALGLAVAVVLVHVVNPQSFHWTMELTLPWLRLLVLGLAVVLAGTLAAWISARAAAGREAVLAVREDW
ncbi:MAG: ABC transporter permease [Burkholderiales bacterium]|nr:ABC transporter permease [Burkholderiales bacterium]